MHTPWRLRGLRCAVQTHLCRIWLLCYRKRNHVGAVERCLSRSASIPNFAQGSRVCCACISGDGRPGENLFPSWGWRDSPYARDRLGGESTTSMELTPILLQEIHKSNREIKALGIIHEDLRRDNILRNEELGRALIIDFHRSTLKSRPTLQRSRAVKRRLSQPETGDPKRLRVT